MYIINYQILAQEGPVYKTKRTVRYLWGDVETSTVYIHVTGASYGTGEFNKATDLENGSILGFFSGLRNFRRVYRSYTLLAETRGKRTNA